MNQEAHPTVETWLRQSLRHNSQRHHAVVDAEHLSDEQLVNYVMSILSADARTVVDQHLSICGACMKEVLRLRAHRAARKSGADVDQSTNTAEDNTTVVALPIGKNSAKVSAVNGWRGAAAAAIGILAVGIWLGSEVSVREYALPQTVRTAKLSDSEPAAAPISDARIAAADDSNLQPAAYTKNKDGIDWYNGYLEASAVGTADVDKITNKVQAEIIAENAARHLAYAQLAEMIAGVQVDSSTSYQNLVLKTSELKAATEGFVRGARIVDRSVEWVGNVPKAKVTLRVPLYGAKSLNAVIDEHGEKKTHPRKKEIVASQASDTTKTARFVIDARNINYQPALRVQIKSEQEQISLPIGGSGRQAGYRVQYRPTLTAATDAAVRVVKARASRAPGTLVLDNADVQAMAAALNNTKNDLVIVF